MTPLRHWNEPAIIDLRNSIHQQMTLLRGRKLFATFAPFNRENSTQLQVNMESMHSRAAIHASRYPTRLY